MTAAMRPIRLKCPSCDGDLTVTRLRCPVVKSLSTGQLALPALLKLTGAQIDFVEVFIKNRGVIRDVRARTRRLVSDRARAAGRSGNALGYSAANQRLDRGQRRLWRRSVLADLKGGKLTPEEALAALNGSDPGEKDDD